MSPAQKLAMFDILGPVMGIGIVLCLLYIIYAGFMGE